MDGRYMYVFVRQDIGLARQMVHVAHATYHMGNLYRSDGGIPSIVVIGVPDAKSLKRVVKKVVEHQLPHYLWVDPDYQEGCTAIATAPLGDAERSVLSNYRLWRYSPGAALGAE